MKIAAIIQARTSSTRLPGKVLKELPYASGITCLEQVIRRLKKSKKLNDIIIATTKEKEDNNIIDIVKNCIDTDITDLTIDDHINKMADYTTNSLVRTYPHGLDVEVFNFNALEKAYKNATKDYEREHVTPYINRNPQKFKINIVKAPKELYTPDIRITLDTEEDYVLLCAVYDYLYPKNKYFSAGDIVNLFNEKPWLKVINKRIIQKKIFDTLEEELEEAKRILDLQDLKKARDFIGEYLSK